MTGLLYGGLDGGKFVFTLKQCLVSPLWMGNLTKDVQLLPWDPFVTGDPFQNLLRFGGN